MLLPESASTYGLQIDRLFWLILTVTGAFFFLVQGCLLWFVIRYRDRPDGSGEASSSRSHRPAYYTHGNNVVEIIWTVIPAVILLGLTLASQKVWAQIRGVASYPRTPVQVEILAEQFAWNIRYPGLDGRFETPDDVTTINHLHLPVGKPTLVRLKSKDVIHSFFVPEFRVKQDAVPGLTTQVWLTPTRAGQYEIHCAELCGLGHYRMRGFVTTESMEAFQAWLKEAKANE